MVEHALQAALGAGLSEAEFWGSTPYQLRLIIEARSKKAYEQAVTLAWLSARFGGMTRLEPLAHYLAGKSEEVARPAATADELRDSLARFDISRDKPVES